MYFFPSTSWGTYLNEAQSTNRWKLRWTCVLSITEPNCYSTKQNDTLFENEPSTIPAVTYPGFPRGKGANPREGSSYILFGKFLIKIAWKWNSVTPPLSTPDQRCLVISERSAGGTGDSGDKDEDNDIPMFYIPQMSIQTSLGLMIQSQSESEQLWALLMVEEKPLHIVCEGERHLTWNSNPGNCCERSYYSTVYEEHSILTDLKIVL